MVVAPTLHSMLCKNSLIAVIVEGFSGVLHRDLEQVRYDIVTFSAYLVRAFEKLSREMIGGLQDIKPSSDHDANVHHTIYQQEG